MYFSKFVLAPPLDPESRFWCKENFYLAVNVCLCVPLIAGDQIDIPISEFGL